MNRITQFLDRARTSYNLCPAFYVEKSMLYRFRSIREESFQSLYSKMICRIGGVNKYDGYSWNESFAFAVHAGADGNGIYTHSLVHALANG